MTTAKGCGLARWREKEIFAYRDPSELEVIRHFTRLSQLNYCIDTGFYPLGSCTMKYNPKLADQLVALPGWQKLHPLQPPQSVTGMTELLADFAQALGRIFGYDFFSLEPAAGAQGEFFGMLVMRNYFKANGQEARQEVIIPDSAHGTNPASAAMAGFRVVTVPSNERGRVDIAALAKAVSTKTAGMMLTNPNTLGLLETEIDQIASIIHNAGGLLYYDGANANALIGHLRPGDLGFDIAHINLHKTFGAPHGGGGPGAGPVGVKKHLQAYLPAAVQAFGGNIAVIIRAAIYLKNVGEDNLAAISHKAKENANYLKERLSQDYEVPFSDECEHEFVISCLPQKKKYGIRALDIAKRLIDYGFHPPTVYFPLIVPECLMIEPTETESKETLDEFISAMQAIAQECREQPQVVLGAPHTAPGYRLDEVQAVKNPRLTYWQ